MSRHDHHLPLWPPTRDEAYFCEDCGRSLSVALGDVPWLVEEMETSATRAKGVDYRTKGGTRSSDKPLPFNQALSDAGAHLRATLVSWVRFCADERVRNSSTSQAIPEDNLPAISRYLLWRVDGLALLDIGPEAVDEITDAVAKCHRLIDKPADRQYLGPCEECEGGRLYARPGAKWAGAMRAPPRSTPRICGASCSPASTTGSARRPRSPSCRRTWGCGLGVSRCARRSSTWGARG
jgi:hypothetical protein